ncbi:MAG TPA: TPM domain-containing protein [Candidatus Baltobacteraceae bacterium]|nr:TPM domain-containing protein [Candidatus Baltobacteraceae bacterium]
MNAKVFVQTLVSLAAAALIAGLPAAAAATPVQDGAGLFSSSTAAQLDQQIEAFTGQTGKQVVVVTVPSLNGVPLAQAAQASFQQQNVNGVLVFIAKDDRQDIILTDNATAQFFPTPTIVSIRQSMEAQFRDGDYDGGVTTAVNGILNVFRAHLSSAPTNGAAQNYPAAPAATTLAPSRRYGPHLSVWTLVFLVVIGYLVLRSIFRPRYYGGPGAPVGPGGAPGAGGSGYGGPGYGGYGYGPGYYGGGGFWSGLLGGLGGAWLGNEMFGNRGTTIVDQPGGNIMPAGQGGSWGGGDAGGWANDAGQADMGGSSSGDWSGGGFGGGGFGEGGGFGGGGFGGGDSGGGW